MSKFKNLNILLFICVASLIYFACNDYNQYSIQKFNILNSQKHSNELKLAKEKFLNTVENKKLLNTYYFECVEENYKNHTICTELTITIVEKIGTKNDAILIEKEISDWFLIKKNIDKKYE